MATRAHRTDTAFFLAVLLLLGGGIFWATQSRSTSTPTVVMNPDGSTSTIAPTATSHVTLNWTGELVFLRDNQVIGRTVAGQERIIYSPGTGTTIQSATAVANHHALLSLSTSATSSIVDLDLAAGTTSNKTGFSTLALVALRPTTNGVVHVTFSNAERDFGSSVVLTQSGNDTTLYKSTDTLTELAWRSDGDALAVGTQTGVTVIPVNAGDAVTTALGAAVRSLTWAGSDILVVTADGKLQRITPGSHTAVAVEGYGTAGRDLVSLGNGALAWLSGDQGAGQIEAAAAPGASVTSLVTATALLGVNND